MISFRFNQVFQELHDGDANVLVCAPTGSGKTVCAELALMRLFTTNPTARAVYIAPKAEVRRNRLKPAPHRFKRKPVSLGSM